MSDITILCVTRADHYALPFLGEMAELAEDLEAPFLVAADGDDAMRSLDGLDARAMFLVRSHGYIESVLDEAISKCDDGYILRLDDDERASEGMYQWLLERKYRQHDHWCFPRANLYPDENTRLAGSEDGFAGIGTLWPDLQTRLSVKQKSGGRSQIHVGSPYGSGHRAPVTLEHHKLIVRDVNDRIKQAQQYERIADGAGSGHYLAFQVPELGTFRTVPYAETVFA